jgi:hypothetical protein
VVKHLAKRIKRLEGGGMNPRHRPCPECGLAVGRIITLDPERGIGVVEAMGGCESCARLRSALPRGSRPKTIQIVRSTPPADPRRAELLRQYAVTDEEEGE